MSPSDSNPPSSRLVSSPTPPRSAGLPALTGPTVRAAVGGCAALAMGMLLVWELVVSISSTVDVRPADEGTVHAASPSVALGRGLPVVAATGRSAPPRDRPVPQVRRPEPQGAAPADAHPVRPDHPVHHRPRHRPGPPSAHASPGHASPGWVRAECLRRFGHDAARRTACEAVLAQLFGH
ncbi:MAG: hypothetical protein JWN52_794 [Actinomycetia bacterium]|nr:hypothetical protein [Actinomycetes bacterium]